MAAEIVQRGLTPREVAKLLRVSPDRVRAWIARGELGAINMGMARCGRPRFVILPHHLREFERGRQAVAEPTPATRRRKATNAVDFYP
jgi:excisionase family DNA binding protein